MAEFTIYHNPKCSKSREALGLLQDKGVDLEIVEYLQTSLSRETLADFLHKIAEGPEALVRKDKRFAELGLNAEDYATAESVVAVLQEHPELMQRPVIVRGARAVIARPGDRALELLD
jgi:arsenate reductase